MKNKVPDLVPICRLICHLLGEQQYGYHSICGLIHKTGHHIYVDEVISIVADDEDFSLEVRKLDDGNPVICVDTKGECYRWHGEAYQIAEHCLDLAIKAINSAKANENTTLREFASKTQG